MPHGQDLTHGAWPGKAQSNYMGPSSCGLTTHRRSSKGLVYCGLGGNPIEGRCRGRLIPHTETGLRTLVGKELELVREVERYSLDIVGLTSMHIIEFRLRMEFLEFCSNHGLPITNSMFKHKGVHKYTWYQCTLGCSLRIDHVLVSLYLQPYVLDGWVKRGAELPLGG